MKRRQFLQYTSLGVISFGFTACVQNNSSKSDPKNNELKSAINFGTLEKTDLSIGIVPVSGAIPLIIAQEKGFFARYGLKVNFYKQPDWQEIEKGLLESRFDAAQALFAQPLKLRLGTPSIPLISLIILNHNGGAITLNKQAWEADIRTGIDYTNFPELAIAYRQYFRSLPEKSVFGIDSAYSMENYLYRYWLASMGINPSKEVKLVEFSPSQLHHKLAAGEISSYSIAEPWNQQAIQDKSGFTVYLSKDIWQGHPSQILATTQGWLDQHPTTSRALVAAILEACQFCDQAENRQEIAQIITPSQYFDLELPVIEPSLIGNYHYSNFEQHERVINIPDFQLFHFQNTNYLTAPDHANYPWHSYGIWLLTQMIRWDQIAQRTYPQNADQIIAQAYPLEIYQDVAQALGIKLPDEKIKIEPATRFIDQREFNPNNPVSYLNQFEIRA
jgi:nitrate/nitrite transport system substrate-binding protein